MKKKPVKRTKLNAKHAAFCVHFTKPGAPTFNNATLSYAIVYNPGIFKLSREVKRSKEGEALGDSPYKRAYDSCGANAARLLGNDRIRKLVQQRLLKIFGDDDAMDERLAQLALQDEDRSVALSAVRDRNKLKKRLADEPAIPPGAEPISKIEIVVRNAVAQKI